MPEEQRLLGIVAHFVLLLKVYGVRPSDVIPYVENMMEDSGTKTWQPEFRAIRDYLLNQSSVVQQYRRERKREISMGSSIT